MRNFILTSLVGVLLLAIPSASQALTTKHGDSVFSGSDQTVSDVYMVGGGTVDLAGTYQNDVYIAGGTVTISGTIDGDVFASGGTIRVSGTVNGNLHAGGGTIDISGSVGGNLMIFGGSLTLDTDSLITGETMLFGGTVTLNGTTVGAVTAWGGSFIVNGHSQADVNLHTGNDCGRSVCVVVGSSAQLDGALNYWASQTATVSDQAVIAGGVQKHAVEVVVSTKSWQAFLQGIRLWSLLSMILVGLLFSLFFPKTLRNVHHHMTTRFGATLGFGVLFFLVIPAALAMLMITLVGLQLALVLAGIYAITLYLTQVALGFWLGWLVLHWIRRGVAFPGQRKSVIIWATLLGIVLLSVVFDFAFGLVFRGTPAILAGLFGLIRLGLTVWALGAMVLTAWGHLKEQQR